MLCKTATFLFVILALFVSGMNSQLTTNCNSYTVIASKDLSASAVSYMASIVAEYCETTSDFGTYTLQLSTALNTLYSCSCVNSFANYQDGSYYYFSAWDIYAEWYMSIVNGGDIYTLVFVSYECTALFDKSQGVKNPVVVPITGPKLNDNTDIVQYNSDQLRNPPRNLQPKFKIDQALLNKQKFALSPVYEVNLAGEVNSKRAFCDCSTFSWVSTGGLSAYYQQEIKTLAIDACSYYPTDAYDYVVYMTDYISEYYFYYASVLVSSTYSTRGYDFYYDWYATFNVGCFSTVVFTNPADCYPYYPPTTFPTPTSLASSLPYSVSNTPVPSNTPYPSVSPSTSYSVGCGSPPCNGHGRCQNNVCNCNSFYYGPQCQYEYCPGNCTYHGACNGNTGECQCYYPYYGCDCSSILYNCTCEHGTCNQLTGTCTCDPGWTGTNCNVSSACADNCFNHGRCTANETCDCFFGWTGEYCNVTDTNCTKGCYNGGSCNNVTGTCSCPDPYFGPQCRWLHCGTGGTNLTCSGHGKCNLQTGSCYCDVGFTGCFCTNWSGTGTPPPAKSPFALPSLLQCGTGGSTEQCSGHGQCNHETGSCYCDPGWQGCYCNQYTGDF